MHVRKLAILPCIECSEGFRLRFGYIIQYKRHFWQKWNNVLDIEGKQLIVSEKTAKYGNRRFAKSKLRNTKQQ